MTYFIFSLCYFEFKSNVCYVTSVYVYIVAVLDGEKIK